MVLVSTCLVINVYNSFYSEHPTRTGDLHCITADLHHTYTKSSFRIHVKVSLFLACSFLHWAACVFGSSNFVSHNTLAQIPHIVYIIHMFALQLTLRPLESACDLRNVLIQRICARSYERTCILNQTHTCPPRLATED